MKRYNILVILAVAFVFVFLYLFHLAHAASGPLQNPGFEAGCSKTAPTDVYDASGAFVGSRVVGEICTPDGWTAFYREGLPVVHDPLNDIGYAQPEMRPIDADPPYADPLRVYRGDHSFQMFTFYKIHDAGLYQQFHAHDGARYELTAWAHAWTAINDDPWHSTTLDPLQATQRIGVDPTGGTDPFADTVIWSEPTHVYDEYGQIGPLRFTAEYHRAAPPAPAALNTVVTVFIRASVLWPFKHNDCYWDAVTLERIPHEVFLPMVGS